MIEWLDKKGFVLLCYLGTFPSIHVKMNTGMNRLGLGVDEIGEFLSILSNCTYQPTIKSIYSHVAASDDPEEDNYTIEQARIFLFSVQTLETGLGYSVMKHLCNSMGILRHPHLHFDMVRVGGGLYGVAECFSPFLSPLLPAISMTSTIAQVRRVKKDSTIGYNRRGRVNQDSLIGIIRIGYADGLRRQLGNGKGQVWIQNCRVPFIGSICMDFAMIDLTDVPIDNEIELENQSVEIFGDHISIEEVAQSCNTIVFEFISTIGQRVKRSYIDDEKTKNIL
jgi:alanine racemase